MDITAISQKIYNQVNLAQNVLLVAHQRPDADALGSMVAFGQWLNYLNTDHTFFCIDQPIQNLLWLNNFEPIQTDPEYLLKQQFDLALVLDSGDLRYAGVDKIFSNFSVKPFIINIDHHLTNRNFGDINLVWPEAVSTTEIIFRIFKESKFSVDKFTASALLAGIIFDTYNFTNPNTSCRSLEVASELLNLGASLPKVSESILKNKSIEALKVWGEILMKISYNPEYRLAIAVVDDSKKRGGLEEAEITEGVANFLNNLGGVKAALILQQQEADIVKGSLRTNDDLIDVARLAKMLGGGGHRKAAGFKVKGKLVHNPAGWRIM